MITSTSSRDGVGAGQASVTHSYLYPNRYRPTVTATCGSTQGSCQQTVSVTGTPEPTPEPTPTPEPGPTPDCSGTFTFTGTTTPVLKPWSEDRRVAPVEVRHLPARCKVASERYTFSLGSSVDLSAVSSTPRVTIGITAETASGNVMPVLIETGDLPAAGLSGLVMGSTCSSLMFEPGGASFSDSLPPAYDGTFDVHASLVGYTAESLNRRTFRFYARSAAAPGDVTVNCWQVEFELEPQ